MKNKLMLFVIGAALVLAPELYGAVCNVNGASDRQSIRGFGASSAWSEWSGCACGYNTFLQNNAAQFFDVNTGIGLSMIRARIPPDTGSWGSTVIPLQAARDQGVTEILATAWTPPAQWKNENVVHNQQGQYLLPSNYQNYANYLRDYVNFMRNSHNVTISAISPANEPDYQVGYDGCSWTGDQLRDFLRDYLGPTFATAGLTTKIIMSESMNNSFAVTDPILNDAAARQYLFAAGVHFYGTNNNPLAYSLAVTHNKEYWQTEISNFDGYEAGMGTTSNGGGLTTAMWLHRGMAVANFNAFFYWWLAADQTNEGLRGVDWGVPKRFWVMGNYSRFIRPGYYRVDATANPTTNIYVTAYRSPGSDRYVIVAVNTGGSVVNQSFSLSGIGASSFVPWITSGTHDLAQQSAVAVSAGAFSYNLPAGSVVSFVSAGAVNTPTRTPTIDPAWTPTRTPTASPTGTATPLSFLLDDMEDGNNQNNWGGDWYSYAGGSSTVVPNPFVMTAGGMPGSPNYRAAISGTINDFGGMGTNLNSAGTGVDLTGYIGAEFYVRGNGGSYWFQFTQPSIEDGDCHGVVFTAPVDWTKVTVLFSGIGQRGFGATAPFTQNAVAALQWASNGNGAIDIQIDDVRLLQAGAATTATFTRTRTSTPTFTRTRTGTPTFTRTGTPTPTFTRTRTGTPTFTRTHTPVEPTATFTRTRTGTPTFTRTVTPSFTFQVPSFTMTPTNTRTATPTFTGTVTPVP
ncbi:MAG TPA: hypothetical protein ENN43_04720, partial [bacterium]|nr:hypothetical protein [bacterium]